MTVDGTLPVSVIILARNEEGAIASCIRSVPFAREVVVVDSGSTDRTKEIAAGLGARVVETEWPGDYGEARNRADTFSSCDFVFHLDADERASAELSREIEAFFRCGDHERYGVTRIPLKEIAFGKWVRHGGFWPQYKHRLYRKGSGNWAGRVHERFEYAVPARVFEHPIVHESFTGISVVVGKVNRYSTIDAEAVHASGQRFRWYRLLLMPVERFFGRYVVHGGFRDGMHGFVLAALTGLNYFLRYLKLWEMEERGRIFEHPVLHESFSGVSAIVGKINRESTIDAERLHAKGRRFRWYRLLFMPIERFVERFIFRGGLRDGMHGFIFAALAGLNCFLRYLELWEIEERERRDGKNGGKPG